MRETFHGELDQIGVALVNMCNHVGSAIAKATQALVEADLSLAESVIADDAVVDDMRKQTEERALDLLARQSPVAGDLRTVVTGLQMVMDLERMGDLAAHVAKVARMRYPEPAVPQELRLVFVELSQLDERLVTKAGSTIAGQDPALAAELESDDDAVDRLHRQLFSTLLDDWKHGIEAAIDVTLLGRYYERFADHAVAVGRRIIYLVTGEMPEPADGGGPQDRVTYTTDPTVTRSPA
jgi:phosphate transport system protein